MNKKPEKKSELTKKPKKEIGSFSISYLKSLFLKETKKKVPELMKNFIQRRYYNNDDNSENRDTSHDKLTDVYISEIRSVSKEKLKNIESLLEEYNKEDDFDSFIEKNSQERNIVQKKIISKKEPVSSVDSNSKDYKSYMKKPPKTISLKNKNRTYTRKYLEKDIGDKNFNEYKNIDKNTYKDLE